MSAFDDLWHIPNSITADKIYRPRKLMTREQAVALLAIVADKPKGTVRQEFIDEANLVCTLIPT